MKPSTVKHDIDNLVPAYTTPEKFENAALFLRLGLPSTLIRHENGAFRKRSSNQGIWKRQLEGKHVENGASRRRWRHDIHVISLTEFSSNTNPKWPVVVAFSNSFGVLWTENIWFLFRVKPPFSNSPSVVWTGPKLITDFFFWCKTKLEKFKDNFW